MHINQASFVKIVDLLTSDKELDYKAIALHILKTNPHIFTSAVDALTRPVPSTDASRPEIKPLPADGTERDQLVKFTKLSDVTSELGEAILQPLIDHNNRVMAIKNLRVVTGWGLKEAKDVIDAVQSGRHDAFYGDIYYMYMLLRQVYIGC